MNQATQTQTLEQTLNKTDLGHYVFEYRKYILGALASLLLAVSGYVLWKQSKQAKAEAISEKVFEFQNKTWKGTKEGKIAITEMLKIFQALDKEVQASPLMVSLGLEVGKYLYEKKQLNEAEAILSQLAPSHPVPATFVGFQRAVVLEELNRVPEAIAVLEKLAQVKEPLMAPRLNLELGRLNLLNGEKGKAQTHLDYVLSNFPNDEEAKLAKLYKDKLAK